MEPNNTEKKTANFAVGIRYGILAAISYVLLILLRYIFFSGNPFVFSIAMLLGYLIILTFFVLAAVARRKELGGYAEIKDLFSTIFVVILFAEIIYTIFNYIYLNFIDPGFFNDFAQSAMEWTKKMGGNQDSVNQQLTKLQEQGKLSGSVLYTLRGLGIWIVIDSIIGMIIALIVRKPKPKF